MPKKTEMVNHEDYSVLAPQGRFKVQDCETKKNGKHRANIAELGLRIVKHYLLTLNLEH
jgi:hypothetical protein